MRDIKVTKCVINERKEVAVSFLIKEWDITIQEHELLRIAKLDWNTIDLEITWLTNWDKENELKAKRQALAILQEQYCERFRYNIEDYLALFYNRIKVKSRTELNGEQLDEEIDSLKASLLSNIS
jgi:hypothetical protein